MRACAECGYELEPEEVLAGRRLCLACRTDQEMFALKWRRKLPVCGECGRRLQRGFCARCYFRHHKRSRQYEPMDAGLKKLRRKAKRA